MNEHLAKLRLAAVQVLTLVPRCVMSELTRASLCITVFAANEQKWFDIKGGDSRGRRRTVVPITGHFAFGANSALPSLEP